MAKVATPSCAECAASQSCVQWFAAASFHAALWQWLGNLTYASFLLYFPLPLLLVLFFGGEGEHCWVCL